MTFCTKELDYPLRAQFGFGLAVHAARMQEVGGHHRGFRDASGKLQSERVPVTEEVRIACSWRKKASKGDLVPNNTTITCKQCSKKLGMVELESSPKRFVVVDNETGEYYKHARHSCNWVKDILDATLYKVKSPAERHTERAFFEDAEGNQLTYAEYNKRRKTEERGLNRSRRKSPRYDVLTITISIDK